MHSQPSEMLTQLIAAQKPGHALQQPFYNDGAIFKHEMQRMIMPHWLCAGHLSSLPRPGDFVTVEIASESVILCRGQDGEIRALLNVCRHRGSRLCTEPAGNARSFVCPYHAWTYGTDGALRSARLMPAEFDRDAHGLKQIHLRVIEGLIFISFAETPLGLVHVEEVMAGTAKPYGWAAAKIAHRATFPVKANWKLAVENYMECYHCSPAHQEYSRHHVFARPPAQNTEIDAKLRQRSVSLGVAICELDRYALHAEHGQETADALRSALTEGAVSGSEDGGPVAPLMGDFTDYDGGVTFFDVGPVSNFLAYPDHGLIYRFIPKTVDRTEMEVIWLVRDDAREGIDYDLARLTWLWNVTSIADKRIIELNQQGINSAFYEPGPYAPMEGGARRFVDWYLRSIG
ncbi:aromatic ring-hydroxylating dioxygenase subunit alpha [Dongia soli]|uniref:Aromatic ring-hydroxylating dioxygenase subunit alpha n=1 Tax=Dongia soli TaxID=600628 RepID=A0ABU5EE87_9PROT|nr:aromatic ring-hydroxylating dioxygenase subunit alpha [Dongia soli]MDY0884665.1 aromatic ring-hydroxylating dioxygenase subunit alpha [Dongia soli]